MALAEQEGIPLITADDKLVKASVPHFPYVVDLESFP
jgi:hypothetical protein